MLGMHARNRSQKQSQFLNALRTSHRRSHRAWVLKDEFERIWHFTYVGAAKQFLKRWMTAALALRPRERSRLLSLKTFVTTVRNHFDKHPLLHGTPAHPCRGRRHQPLAQDREEPGLGIPGFGALR